MTFSELKNWWSHSLASLYSEREALIILKTIIPFIQPTTSWTALVTFNEDCTNIQQTLFENGWLDRLLQGEPIQYITETTDFFGLPFYVNSNVLIPRPETEELVDWILMEHTSSDALQVIDLGTGSGCIPISLAINRLNWQIVGVDISPSAIDVAMQNAKKNGVSVHFRLFDILNEALEGEYDIIVSNPPYITQQETAQMLASTIAFEPHLALFTGSENASIFYERIGQLGLHSLKENGILYFELNEFYANEIQKSLEKLGYKVIIRKDLQGKPRMAKCIRH